MNNTINTTAITNITENIESLPELAYNYSGGLMGILSMFIFAIFFIIVLKKNNPQMAFEKITLIVFFLDFVLMLIFWQIGFVGTFRTAMLPLFLALVSLIIIIVKKLNK